MGLLARIVSGLAAASSLLVACGGAPDTGVGPNGVVRGLPVEGLFAGEAMRFDVLLEGMLVGTADFVVGEHQQIDGLNTVQVSSGIHAAGIAKLVVSVEDSTSTVINLDSGRPLLTTSDATYNQNHSTSSAIFDDRSAEVVYQRNEQPPIKQRLDLAQHLAHDTHTAMAFVRAWDCAPGDSVELWMVGGRRIWKSDVTCTGPTTIGTANGNLAAVRFDGVARRMKRDLTPDTQKPARPFSVWISDDTDRVPLRVRAHVEYGDVEMVLTDYQRP